MTQARSHGLPKLGAARVLLAAFFLCVPLTSCGIMGCQCAEMLEVRRSRAATETVIAPQQTGGPMTVTITAPPQSNWSMCAC